MSTLKADEFISNLGDNEVSNSTRAKAQYKLAFMCLGGQGGLEDHTKARELFEFISNLGDIVCEGFKKHIP